MTIPAQFKRKTPRPGIVRRGEKKKKGSRFCVGRRKKKLGKKIREIHKKKKPIAHPESLTRERGGG